MTMKIIAYDRFKPGVGMETVRRYIREEVANVWRLWKAGIVRENYARADQNGVVIVFECSSVDEAKRYVDFIPVSAPLPLEFVFDSRIDSGEPFDRTVGTFTPPSRKRRPGS